MYTLDSDCFEVESRTPGPRIIVHALTDGSAELTFEDATGRSVSHIVPADTVANLAAELRTVVRP